jgi:hypothetical protein
MSLRKTTLVALAILIPLMCSVVHANAPSPEEFVTTLFQRFAYRDPQPSEVTYWSERIVQMTPEAAETHLKNWFFVHAAYKSCLNRTVNISEVEGLVNALDKDQITYQAVQWSIFTSDEYKQAKAAGKAGTVFVRDTNPLP